LDDLASRFAASLRARGIGAGDVISVQLPNWWETAVVLLAASRLGAVLNPLQMIYRQGELRFILRQCDSRALVVPRIFRGFDYADMAAEVVAELKTPPLLIVARGAGDLPF